MSVASDDLSVVSAASSAESQSGPQQYLFQKQGCYAAARFFKLERVSVLRRVVLNLNEQFQVVTVSTSTTSAEALLGMAVLRVPEWSTLNCRCGPPDKPCFQVFSGSILRTVVLPPSMAPEHLWCPPHRSCHLSRGKAECMHASIACLLLYVYEDYVWVSLGNAMKAKQSKSSALDSEE
jgi:hypothetical protein